jgi:hypothetical protein
MTTIRINGKDLTPECHDKYNDYKKQCESVEIKSEYLRLLTISFEKMPTDKLIVLVEKLKVARDMSKNCMEMRKDYGKKCKTPDTPHLREIVRAKHFLELYTIRISNIREYLLSQNTQFTERMKELDHEYKTLLDQTLTINRGGPILKKAPVPKTPKKTIQQLSITAPTFEPKMK